MYLAHFSGTEFVSFCLISREFCGSREWKDAWLYVCVHLPAHTNWCIFLTYYFSCLSYLIWEEWYLSSRALLKIKKLVFSKIFKRPDQFSSVQFSSVAQSCPALCNPIDCSAPGLSVHHQVPEFTQTHVHRVGDAIQPSHLLSTPSPPAVNLSQHQGLFIWVSSSHHVAKVLELQLQHHSFQWIFRTDLL